MGYTIPSGDYSLPPLQVSVGAELGKSFGSALAAYGARRDKERKEAQELLDTQNALRNTIAIKQAELKTAFDASLKLAGVEKGSSLFDQYQEVIKQKGQQAMEAQMNMNFATDITDEQRAEYANSISSFKSYAQSSLTQMGRLIADVDNLNNSKYIVVGNAKNGEQLVNRIALGAIGDVNEEVYGAGVIVDKKLTEQNGSNIVSSTVKIPTNSKFFKQVANGGGKGIYDQLQAGLSNGKIVEKDGYYVFKNTIDVSNYESRGGMDYLQEKIDGVKANEFLMNAKVLDKNAAFTHLSKPFITSGNELNIDGEKTGYYVTNETEIVDLAASTTSKEFRDQLDAEYDRVFKSGSSVSQMQDYLYSIGIVDDITGDEWQNLSVAKRKQKINNALTEHLFEGRFAGLANPSEKVNQVAVVLKEGDEKSEQILAAAIEQGIQNPLNNNQPYKMGDTIYIKESQVRDKRKDVDSSEVLSLYKILQDKGEANVKKQLVNVPINIKGRGKFLVDKSGQFRLVSGSNPRLYPIVSDTNFFEALNDAVKTE
ncbi:hypothetical protein [Marinobacter sp.]|uniref:hypothetical protein n=1 Tax=Marinobacter sp. TaxID=50741 RepID=UPI0025809E5A|nr:hypothetical protein [Marinobacter sp.]